MKFLRIIRSFLFGLSLVCLLPGNELSAVDQRFDGMFGNHSSRKPVDNPLHPKSAPAPSVGDKPLNGQSKEKGADSEQPAAADIDSSLPESFKRLGLRPFPSFPQSKKASKEQPVPADQASLPESFKHLGLSPFPSFPSRDDRDRKDKELLGHKNGEPGDAQLVLNGDKQWSDEELLAIYNDDIESGRLVITEEEMAGLQESFIQKNQRKLTDSLDQFVFEKKLLETVRSGKDKSYSELRSEIQRESASGRLPITAQENHALTELFWQQNVVDFIRFVREQKPALIIREDESLLDAGLSDEKLWPIILADLRSGRITEEDMAGLKESFLEQNQEKFVRLLIPFVAKKKMLEAARSGKPKKSESLLKLEAQHAIQSGKGVRITREEEMLLKASFFQKNQAELARFIRAEKVAEAVYAATWRGKCALLIKTNYASLPSPVKHAIDVSLGISWALAEQFSGKAVDRVAREVSQRVVPARAQEATEKIVGVVAEGAVKDCFVPVVNGVLVRVGHNPNIVKWVHKHFFNLLAVCTVVATMRPAPITIPSIIIPPTVAVHDPVLIQELWSF